MGLKGVLMKYLDLEDLDINYDNYKVKASGLREWFVTSMEYSNLSLRQISKDIGVPYRTLWNFYRGRTNHMMHKYMLSLVEFIETLIERNKIELIDPLEEGLTDEDYFHS